MKKITTDKALMVSALILLIYTIICIVMLFLGKETDSTLTACVFASFGVAEGGYCTFIYHTRKKHEKGQNTEEIDNADGMA